MKILIIEDEQSIIEAISIAFEFRWSGVDLRSATRGFEGLNLVKKESPDVVILDLNLPDISGFEVLKKIREFSSVPVIILTVRAEDEDMLKGLEAGADDYIIKPFNYLTLLARVKAVLRRTEAAPLQVSRTSTINDRLSIDFVNQRVTVENNPVKLTQIEYKLLVLLVKNKDKVVTYDEIMDEIWDKDLWTDTDNVRIYIRRLRKKLNDIPPSMLLNQHGAGYIFKS